MSRIRRLVQRLHGRSGQSTTEYVLTISVITIAALAATSAFDYAYTCMFNGTCDDFQQNGGLPQALADSLTKDGIQGVADGAGP